MSADNGYVVVPHPDGGYSAVMYFASDDDPDLSVRVGHDPRFNTIEEAFVWASNEYSEYGVSVSEECSFAGKDLSPCYEYLWSKTDVAVLNDAAKTGWRVVPGTILNGYILMEREL